MPSGTVSRRSAGRHSRRGKTTRNYRDVSYWAEGLEHRDVGRYQRCKDPVAIGGRANSVAIDYWRVAAATRIRIMPTRAMLMNFFPATVRSTRLRRLGEAARCPGAEHYEEAFEDLYLALASRAIGATCCAGWKVAEAPEGEPVPRSRRARSTGCWLRVLPGPELRRT